MNIGYNGNAIMQQFVIDQIAAHEAHDEIMQGRYWANGKGCFIGCIAHDNSAEKVEEMTGMPVMLTRIAEGIFETLPNDIAKGFPGRVTRAIPMGATFRLSRGNFYNGA